MSDDSIYRAAARQNPTFELLFEKLEALSQELTEKETREAEWESIRSSTRWVQIEGRMNDGFFEGVRGPHANNPVHLFRVPNDAEYTTIEEMAIHDNPYYHALFTSQGTNKACFLARKKCCVIILRKVTPSMSAELTRR